MIHVETSLIVAFLYYYKSFPERPWGTFWEAEILGTLLPLKIVHHALLTPSMSGNKQKLAAAYSLDDDATWTAAAEAAEHEVEKANKVIAARVGLKTGLTPGRVTVGFWWLPTNLLTSTERLP